MQTFAWKWLDWFPWNFLKFYCSEPYRKLFFVDDVITERYRVQNFRDGRRKIVNTYLDYHFSSTKALKLEWAWKLREKIVLLFYVVFFYYLFSRHYFINIWRTKCERKRLVNKWSTYILNFKQNIKPYFLLFYLGCIWITKHKTNLLRIFQMHCHPLQKTSNKLSPYHWSNDILICQNIQ